MKKLLKKYDLNSDMQYFEMIVNNFVNGNIKDGISFFKEMPKIYRKAMVKSIVSENWNSGLNKNQILTLIEYI